MKSLYEQNMEHRANHYTELLKALREIRDRANMCVNLKSVALIASVADAAIKKAVKS